MRKKRLTYLQRQAAKRRRLLAIRKAAPKHPVAPEARIRTAVSALLGHYHDHLKTTILEHARNRHIARTFKMGDKLSETAKGELYDFGKYQLQHGPFRRTVNEQAQKTADSAKRQVGAALSLEDFDPDLSGETADFADGLYDMADARLGDSLERANDILEDWDGEDVEALQNALDDGLDGILGGALAQVALAYGYAWSQLNKSAQEAAVVAEYMWVSQHDSAVRPEHLALDNETAAWDEPPLSAEDSSNGEECHPGEDWGCRCVASPIPPEGLPN